MPIPLHMPATAPGKSRAASAWRGRGPRRDNLGSSHVHAMRGHGGSQCRCRQWAQGLAADTRCQLADAEADACRYRRSDDGCRSRRRGRRQRWLVGVGGRELAELAF